MTYVWYFIVCAVFRFTDVPEEQDVNVADDIHEEKIYDDLCSLKAKAGSQVPHSPRLMNVYLLLCGLQMGIFFDSLIQCF